MYALAASTTGVSLLALAQPAAAKIIYTPAKVGIRVGMSYNLDLNRDGISDFRLGVYYTAITQNGTGTRIYDLYVRALQKPNAAVIGNRGFARAFRPGITVGPKQVFGPGTFSTTMAGCRNGRAQTSRGPWLNVQNRYLGLRFTINGRIHYGWARLTTTGCPLSGTLTGYAYETVPNRPILTGKTRGPDEIGDSVEIPSPATLTAPAPKPASLGLLALGSPALSIWRREESVGARPSTTGF
jgi:hypothetical protein